MTVSFPPSKSTSLFAHVVTNLQGWLSLAAIPGPSSRMACWWNCVSAGSNECGSTHALLLSGPVPYSRTKLQDQADIICGKSQTVMERNPLVDESCVRSILRMFRKHWKQAILSASIPLHPLRRLVDGCFSFSSRQFMQIKRTPNILFLKST